MSSRRTFLRLAGGAAGAVSVGLLAACRAERTTAGTAGEKPVGQQEAGSAASQRRLLARPSPSPPTTAKLKRESSPMGAVRKLPIEEVLPTPRTW